MSIKPILFKSDTTLSNKKITKFAITVGGIGTLKQSIHVVAEGQTKSQHVTAANRIKVIEEKLGILILEIDGNRYSWNGTLSDLQGKLSST